MKFDFVIGNPPYQQEAEKKSEVNGQTRRRNIFQLFQLEADKIADVCSVMIYPGARWIHQSGKGVEKFGYNLINDRALSVLVFYPDAKEVFANAADIADGISVVVKKKDKTGNGFRYVYIKNGKEDEVNADNPGDDLLPLNPRDNEILHKVKIFVESQHLTYLHDGIYSQKMFGIESDFVQNNPSAVRPYTSDLEVDFLTEVKLFTNDKAGSAGRSIWYVVKKELIMQKPEFISQWQVVVSSAHAGGQEGRGNQLEIIDNHSAFGRARVALKSFQTYEEAHNFYVYATSDIVRYTFLMTDESLTSLAKRVPDILDYSDKQQLIDFGGDIDEQLCRLMQITKDEFAYIQGIVK